VLSWIKKLVRKGLSKTVVLDDDSIGRRVRLEEVGPDENYVLIVALMIIFFVGLVFLEIIHMVWMGSWNDAVFNGIMLVVGTIVGAVWGRSSK
jgi:hypothetical protein